MALTKQLRAWKQDITAFVKDGLGLELSPAQATLLRSIYAMPLSPDQMELFRLCTGRDSSPVHPAAEVTVIAGARAGKDSRIAAPIALYEAIFGDHTKHLARGERGVLPIVAADARGTKIAFGYMKDYLTGSPILSTMIEDVLANEIILTNRISIVCFPCTLRSLRGWSIPVAIMDEVGFYRLEGTQDSDVEIQASVRRGMVGFPATKLIKISTPYMRSGVLYDDFTAGFGVDNPDLLVWKASSVLMNPSLEGRLEREKRLDPLRYSREFEAEFSEDISAFLPAKWIEDAVVSGRYELPYNPQHHYAAACDPSGGGADAFTFCIAHMQGEGQTPKVVQDVIKGWERVGTQAPDLVGVVKEISQILCNYGLDSIVGDRYSGQWVKQAFSEQGITYRESELDKSQAYLETEPLFAQGRIELLDHERQNRELKMLERRPRQGGKTVVDHPLRFHDDYANVLALAAVSCTITPGPKVAAGFDSTRHVQDRLSPIKDVPILVGQTFGLMPATVIGQARAGFIRIYGVLVCENGGTRQFYERAVLPWLSNHAPWALESPSMVNGRYDPVGEMVGIEEAPAYLIQRLLPGYWSPGPNKWEAMKELLLDIMTRTVSFEPALQIDYEGGKPLIQALSGQWYREADRDRPKDNPPWSSIGQAFCFLLGGTVPTRERYEEITVLSDFKVLDVWGNNR